MVCVSGTTNQTFAELLWWILLRSDMAFPLDWARTRRLIGSTTLLSRHDTSLSSAYVSVGDGDQKKPLQIHRPACHATRPACLPVPPNGELRTQKLKSHLVRTQSFKVLPLKPGVGQYIAIHATLTARDFFLAYCYPSGPFTCIFSKLSPDFFLCWLWLTPVPV